MQVANNQVNVDRKSGLNVWNRYPAPGKILAGATLITAVGLAAVQLVNAYFEWKKRQPVDCKFGAIMGGVTRDFKFFENAAKNGNNAADQYCLGELFETGRGTPVSLKDARFWYKKAAEQGLHVARKELCTGKMFEHQFNNVEDMEMHWESLNEYELEYRSLCCPPKPATAICGTCLPAPCPWSLNNFLLYR